MNKDTKKVNKIRVSGVNRFAELTVMGEKIFTVQDVAQIGKIKNRQTLRMLLARYVQRGILYRIWRGLYSITNPKEIDPIAYWYQNSSSICLHIVRNSVV